MGLIDITCNQTIAAAAKKRAASIDWYRFVAGWDRIRSGRSKSDAARSTISGVE